MQVDDALVFARDEDGDGLSLQATPPGAQANRTSRAATSPMSRVTTIRFDDTDCRGATIVAPAPAYLDADGLMTVRRCDPQCSRLVGGMERCMDYALTYANERVQFGRPIGKFQAVQHMLAIAAGHFAAATAAADALTETERLGDELIRRRDREGALWRGCGSGRRRLPSGAWRDGLHAGPSAAFREPPAVGMARRMGRRNLLAGADRPSRLRRSAATVLADAVGQKGGRYGVR